LICLLLKAEALFEHTALDNFTPDEQPVKPIKLSEKSRFHRYDCTGLWRKGSPWTGTRLLRQS
jgi:hypothetical protein